MNLKDDLLNFLGEATAAATNDLSIQETLIAEGLCVACENRPHCIWVENTKIYCEHYE